MYLTCKSQHGSFNFCNPAEKAFSNSIVLFQEKSYEEMRDLIGNNSVAIREGNKKKRLQQIDKQIKELQEDREKLLTT